MINRLSSKFSALLFIFSFFLASCGDNDVVPVTSAGPGYFILNEGTFGKGNTSLSFFSETNGAVTNDIFQEVNGIPLGDQAQSMTITNDLGYIVVQGSSKIEVINTETSKIVTTIDTDIASPRYFVTSSTEKGYVSDWGPDGITGTVKVIDLGTNTVSKTIQTGQGPNEMLLDGDKLYVANVGGWGRDNTISVLNTTTDEVSSTISVIDNPNSLQKDADGNIWILSLGHTEFDDEFNVVIESSTSAGLTKIDANGAELLKLPFEGLKRPSRLVINNEKNTLFYIFDGGVYAISTSATSLPTEKFINKNYYALSVHPTNNSIIACAAPDFSSPGSIDVYLQDGTFMKTHTVGIAPNACAFK